MTRECDGCSCRQCVFGDRFASAAAPNPSGRVRVWTFAVAGNPNSGKTTLFNGLTGLRQKVANYPGVTVEKKVGFLEESGRCVQLVDLPGTYSLSPKSEEERIASDVVAGRMPGLPPPDGVVCVVDANSLERSLYLVLQVKRSGRPFAVVLNMMDEFRRRGGAVDTRRLSKRLGAPVFAVSAYEGGCLPALRRFLGEWKPSGRKPRPQVGARTLEEAAELQREAARLARAVLVRVSGSHSLTDRLDSVALSPLWGPLLFLALVLAVFQSIFTWAHPLMDGLDALITGFGGRLAAALPDGLWKSFLVDGLVAGVGSVLVFLPQILILFLFIGILEHSGYMARAAVIMDRLMARIGLQGKSFLPLLSSHACAVPAILSTRTIESRRDRLATIFIAPLMTCSARLPVYTLLIAAFVPDLPVAGRWLGLRTLVLLGLYLAGFAAAVATAWALKSTVLKSDPMPFVMELPPYRIPSLRTVLLLMGERARVFLEKAGTVILAVSVVMWLLASFPRPEAAQSLERSYAGRVGKAIEPVLQPLGFDWRIGMGLLSAQAAREVVISTLATLYGVEKDPSGDQGLQAALRKHLSPLAAVSLVLWFVFSLQCTSTLTVMARETAHWKWPLLAFLYMGALAYLSCLIVYQGGCLLGWG